MVVHRWEAAVPITAADWRAARVADGREWMSDAAKSCICATSLYKASSSSRKGGDLYLVCIIFKKQTGKNTPFKY